MQTWLCGLADSDANLSVFLYWLAKHGQAYLEHKERDFGMEVQRKRVKFGLPVS